MSASRKGREGRKDGNKRCAENRSSFVRHAVGDSFNSILQVNLAKVDKQSELPIAQSKLSQNLLRVNLGEALDRLQFNEHFVFDQQVSAEALFKSQAIVMNWDWHLSLNIQASLPEFVRKQDFVNCFEQARSRLRVNAKSSIENDSRECVFVHRRPALRVQYLSSIHQSFASFATFA